MVTQIRSEAWRYGRRKRNQLLDQYCQAYGLEDPPPPALIIDELLTDFLGATLRYDPLSLDIFAKTEWRDERPHVTVNLRTSEIIGVKNAVGVQNVAKFHEMVHVDRDLAVLQAESQLDLCEPGPSLKIVCYRMTGNKGIRPYLPQDAYLREVWAEEAGRAAAVSYFALSRSDGFQAFLSINEQGPEKTNSLRWKSLSWAADEIGVNMSALVNQLELEGLISVHRTASSNMVYPQAKLFSLMGAR